MAITDFAINQRSQWCVGCGDFAIVGALKQALSEMNIPNHQTVISSGIGCSGKAPHYVNVYGFEGLHGRALPVASGIKLANHKLNVIALGGDGDGYGIGAGHFVHVMRRNYDMAYIVHNNQIYGLTTGQASPTTQVGMKTKTTPNGVVESQFNPLATAIMGGASFVGRAFAGDIIHLKAMMKEAIAHRGFALLDVLQPCVTFNKLNTYDFFTQRCYKLQDAGHDSSDKMKAIEKAMEDYSSNYQKIPVGVFYKVEKPTYEDTIPWLKDKALVEQPLDGIDISPAYHDLE